MKYKKTIEAGDRENEFTINLEVQTTQSLESIPTSNDSAVILVLDTSGSMKTEDIYHCGQEAHQHSIDNGCYELTCDKSYHKHNINKGCYTLICEKVEHQHDKYSCDGTSRIKEMQDSVAAFLESYKASAKITTLEDGTTKTDKRLVALVKFSSSAQLQKVAKKSLD